MSLEVKRKEKESSQNLVRRFAKRLQQSGILVRARKNQFKKREKSRELRKRTALRRKEIKKQDEKIKKLGKL